MDYKKVFSELKKNGFLDYGRINGLLALLENIVNVKKKKEDSGIIAEITKRGVGTCRIKFKNNVSFSGKPEKFEEEFNILREDCWIEYARSVRDKQLLLNPHNIKDSFKLIIVPVILEALNIQNIDTKKFKKIIDKKHAHITKWFLFTKDVSVKTSISEKKFMIKVKNSSFELKNPGIKVSGGVKKSNMGQYPFFENDLFGPGLPYTIMVLNGKKMDYEIKGNTDELIEIAEVILRSIHDYIMIEHV